MHKLLFELNRIIDGTIISKKYPHTIEDMCKTLRNGLDLLESRISIEDLIDIKLFIIEIPKIMEMRNRLCHGYLGGTINIDDQTWLSFVQFKRRSSTMMELEKFRYNIDFINKMSDFISNEKILISDFMEILKNFDPY